ncbi:type II secretion system F family protein, partial [Rhizobium ruizarguesonis]
VDKRQDFGLHLSIMMLEVRGGRRLREALANLAVRLRIDEARALSVLFRQSEVLGTSVTQTLRVYCKEMRDLRIIRAEEKANALPVKMLLPLGAFLFP